MALYSTGPIVGSISGKLGGAVFASAHGQAIIRKAPKPRAKPSSRQLQLRAFSAYVRTQWAVLSDLEKDQWNTWAQSQTRTNRLGLTRTLTGRQAYIALRMSAPFRNYALVRYVIPGPLLDPLEGISLSFAQGGPYNVTLSPTTTDPFVRQGTAICRPMRTTSLKFWAPWTWLETIASANPTRDFQADIDPLVGPLVAGEVVAVMAVRASSYLAAPCAPVSTWTTVT